VSFAVSFRNAGSAAWPSGGANPVRVSYHWHNGSCPGTSTAVFEGLRTNLAASVPAGGVVSDMVITIDTPSNPGAYCFEIDLVQEGIAFFESAASGTRSFNVVISPQARQPSQLVSGAGRPPGTAQATASNAPAPDPTGPPPLAATTPAANAPDQTAVRVVSASASPAIRPPNTGDAGLR
jgi:hypothetical protein